MRTLVLALALLPAAAMAADRDPPVKRGKACRTQPQMADAKPALKAEPPRSQTLDRMPPAEAQYPVLVIVDGCEQPLKVRDFRR